MKQSFSVMTVFGTRPEAIKMAPLIKEMTLRGMPQTVCVTGQHREMLHQMLSLFQIKPDFDLEIMTERQSLEEITSRVLLGMKPIFDQAKPSIVLVQGDTATAFAAALAAFYQRIPVGHVEAGLRTHEMYDPFPEEMARRLISQLSSIHFAPTRRALDNLIADGIAQDSVHITGNTVVDALLELTKENRPFESSELQQLNLENLAKSKHLVIVTAHRRENIGQRMENIFNALRRLAEEFPDVEIVFPVHMNPIVGEHARKILGSIKNVHLVGAVGYADMTKLLNLCYAVMTDSGGIQEEAPALNKPVLVLRETTERGEGIDAGTAMLAGGENEESIFLLAKRLLTDGQLYSSMAEAPNPYGDGMAARKIIDWVEAFHHHG